MTTVVDRPTVPPTQTDGAGPPRRPVPQASGGGRELWWALTTAFAVGAVIIAAIALFLPSSDGSSTPATTVAAVTGEPQVFAVELGDLYVKPNQIEVEAGRPVVLTVTNASASIPHDLKLDGATGTAMLDPGQSEEIDLGVVSDGAQAWCTVPGHKAAGMVVTFVVKGAAPTSAPAGPSATDAASPAAVIDPQAVPTADWKPYDPSLKPAPGGTTHDLTLHATEVVQEVAPGVTQEVWTFNDQVPGPALRGKVGDVFNVTLVNDGKLGHSIDFHASRVAWNDEMRTIQPGESLVYQFKAEHAGVFMYHCGTAPALHHIGNGMFGAIIVDPPVLAPVDHEYLLVQSELYLGPEGSPGDLAKMQGDDWDAVVFNGFHNQYMHAPIRVEPDERVRVWVLDAGPSENSSFHIVGTVFDTVFSEGTYLLQPDDRQGGSQALGLQPAQGGFVEFSFAEAGLYPIVTHKFANVGKGALGLFQAGEVDATGGGH
jgi:nitrite reductase (NO-forming)